MRHGRGDRAEDCLAETENCDGVGVVREGDRKEFVHCAHASARARPVCVLEAT